MNNLKNRLIAFMYGRYGLDTLYYALLGLWGVFWLLGILTQNAVFSLLSSVCLIWMLFRALSRNLTARRKENDRFLHFWNPVKTFFRLQWMRIRECRTHVYRSCPQCHATLRLPRRKGEHNAVCPRCQNRFLVHIRF